MFSSITIRQCGIRGDEFQSLHLNAASSFPACPRALEEEEQEQPVADSWAPRNVSKSRGKLELSLLYRISEGRIGVTYAARIMPATVGGIDVPNNLPEEFCLKFAKRPFCRSPIREAWFYERLTTCQGASVARCYVFFASMFSEQEHIVDDIVPWTNIRIPSEPSRIASSPIPSIDWLPDDLTHIPYFRDVRGFRRGSPWNSWNTADDNPTVAVLVLEKLAECCNEHWRMGWNPPEGLRYVCPAAHGWLL